MASVYLTPSFHKADALGWKQYVSLLYNAVQMIGWMYAGIMLATAVVAGGGTNASWQAWLGGVAFPAAGATIVALQQLAMVTEPLLSIARIIPSKLFVVIMQLIARNVVILVAVGRHTQLQQHISVALFFVAWISIEVVRFPWLMFKTLGEPPLALSYIRYALPLLVYPLGGVGEFWAMWRAGSLHEDVWGAVAGVKLSLPRLVNWVYIPLFLPTFLMLYVNAWSQFGAKRRTLGQAATARASKAKHAE